MDVARDLVDVNVPPIRLFGVEIAICLLSVSPFPQLPATSLCSKYVVLFLGSGNCHREDTKTLFNRRIYGRICQHNLFSLFGMELEALISRLSRSSPIKLHKLHVIAYCMLAY